MLKPVDVLVAGGGVIGLAIAREAARAGLRVRLLERATPGAEASGASAGILAAQMEAGDATPILPLALRSRDMYRGFLGALREETAIDVDLRREGTLLVARAADERSEIEAMHRFQSGRGLAAESIDGPAVRRLEPAVAEDALRGLLLPDEASLDPARLLRALRAAAERAGVAIRTRREATRLLFEGERVVGAATADGAVHPAGAVVVAAGAWSGQLAGEGFSPPRFEPVRGQMACFRAPGLLTRVVAGGGIYLVPRSDGRVLVGSTTERAGFDRHVTAAGLRHLTQAALALVPGLATAPLERAWAGLRPAASDGLPVIGAARPGLLFACGHYRNGIVLTPLTARVIVTLLRGGTPEIDLAPFSPLRFGADATRS